MCGGRSTFLAVVLLALVATPAGAKTGPGNSWTQLLNGNWPVDSSNPKCSPCVKWPNYYYEGHWSLAIKKAGAYPTQARAAVKEWSGQPFPSPVFAETTAGCAQGGDWQLCLAPKYVSNGFCGYADVFANGNAIYSSVAYVNYFYRFYDGAPPSGQTGCDLRATYHHELGHSFSEGHSAIRTDLMNARQGTIEHVDADAKAELKAVYGTLNTGGCPCLAYFTQLKEKALQEAAALDGVPTGEDLGYPE